MKIQFRIAIVILFVSISAFSQEIKVKFEKISLEHGLSQNSIRSIFQDSKGFMWFGSGEGLNRYDGYNIDAFTHDPDDSTSLSHNWVYSIFEDREGVLWVGTNGGGLCKYNRDTENFTRYQTNPDDPNSLSDNVVFTILG